LGFSIDVMIGVGFAFFLWQWFPNYGTRTSSGMRRLSRCYL